MIRHFFRLGSPLNPNAADALAVALCHLNTVASTSRWKESARP
jgi:Holliday junction resolvasome RuvABC endonuclease subunit